MGGVSVCTLSLPVGIDGIFKLEFYVIINTTSTTLVDCYGKMTIGQSSSTIEQRRFIGTAVSQLDDNAELQVRLTTEPDDVADTITIDRVMIESINC